MINTSLKTRMLEAFRLRMYFFISVATVAFFALFIQIVNLQIIQGGDYKLKSRMNMENCIPIPASRGEIYDRNLSKDNKVVIVSNRPSFNITIIPAQYKTKKKLYEVIDHLGTLLNVQSDDIRNELSQKNPWERIIIKEDVSFEAVVKIASRQDLFPYVDWEDAPVRVYNFGNMFSHAIGYIGTISKEEYKKNKTQGYKHYQKIGKAGLEKQYDNVLRGTDGYIRRIVDVRNRTEGEEIGQKPFSGNNLVMTIDYDIQKTAFDAMGDVKGALVVLKPATGEVLSLVSKPDYDPNEIISKNNYHIIQNLYSDKNRPFLNRAIQSKYPPASTFKLITAISGLETEKTYPSKSYYCPGKYTLKGYVDTDFYCYEVHNTLDLQWAIAKSCSVYFYQLGKEIGPTSILTYAEHFGLNKKTGIDLPGEVPGFIPSKRWKLKTFGQQWFDGDTVNLSIGQGFLHVTAIEMVNFIAALVNNGVVYRPRLVNEIRSTDNSVVIKKFPKVKIMEIPLSPFSIATIEKGMRMSVTSGTSGLLGSIKVPLAGKTGTAQTRSIRTEKFSQHGWFVGYGPYEGPPESAVAIAVIVEYGIAGAATAVPIADKIFRKLYDVGYFR